MVIVVLLLHILIFIFMHNTFNIDAMTSITIYSDKIRIYFFSCVSISKQYTRFITLERNRFENGLLRRIHLCSKLLHTLIFLKIGKMHYSLQCIVYVLTKNTTDLLHRREIHLEMAYYEELFSKY